MYIYLNVCPRVTQPNLELGFAFSFLWWYIHPKNDKLNPIEMHTKEPTLDVFSGNLYK